MHPVTHHIDVTCVRRGGDQIAEVAFAFSRCIDQVHRFHTNQPSGNVIAASFPNMRAGRRVMTPSGPQLEKKPTLGDLLRMFGSAADLEALRPNLTALCEASGGLLACGRVTAVPGDIRGREAFVRARDTERHATSAGIARRLDDLRHLYAQPRADGGLSSDLEQRARLGDATAHLLDRHKAAQDVPPFVGRTSCSTGYRRMSLYLKRVADQGTDRAAGRINSFGFSSTQAPLFLPVW
ncbi:MAG: type I-F CRISPR-associated endoribonuclease Cas6/Csy4 [Alphaproteobacteria bacterium]|nr:type I-F CRISPR-associated endoribonuclease Cas6/Csy4 [Alphaproteobacteria bacterium]